MRNASATFYDDRYCAGYMEEWPSYKKRRVLDLVKALGLPRVGRALDFGCGNGVFTEVLRHALPGWSVAGCDVSAVAVENARKRYPQCEFFVSTDGGSRTYDLVFSHHVLEHVDDIEATVRLLGSYAGPAAAMLHILPCGNAGSLEHGLCVSRADGIDRGRGNRFFYEDPGHLRRLTSSELSASLRALSGFELRDAWFANQRWGAVDFITSNAPSFIRTLTDPAKQAPERRASLRWARWAFLALWALRFPTKVVESRKRWSSLKRAAAFGLALPLYPAAKAVDATIRRAVTREWLRESKNSAGSEMYLYLVREGSRGRVLAARERESGPA
jgi:SAM-dependent methyltransferase